MRRLDYVAEVGRRRRCNAQSPKSAMSCGSFQVIKRREALRGSLLPLDAGGSRRPCRWELRSMAGVVVMGLGETGEAIVASKGASIG